MSEHSAHAPSVSVVIPAYNEAQEIGGTLQAAAAAMTRSGFRGQFLIVDDGSADGTAEAARAAAADYSLQVISQPNQGRLAARRAGLQAVDGEYVLFLDSRVTIDPESLSFVRPRLDQGQTTWNAHVEIEKEGNPYGQFWDVLTGLAFAAYFANPRTTSFTAANFDAFPKGTTCFLTPTELAREAFVRFRSRYTNERYANDDTPILRWIAEQQPINISPHFRCVYRPRDSFRGFVRHAFHRGTVFLDGHGRREAALFPAVIAFYPLSLVAMAMLVRRPWIAAGLPIGMAAAAAAAAIRGYPASEVLAFSALTPAYAAAHGAGMWRGLGLLLKDQLFASA